MKIQASHINESGLEICNICGREADKPYRYQTERGERGCVSECHDIHIRRNTNPEWAKSRYVLPKWVTECRKAIKSLELRA
jgi:hypothetical protein